MTENEHILTCLAEECAEVAKNVSKALRFGPNDAHPEGCPANWELVLSEMEDLLAVYAMAQDAGLLRMPDVRFGPDLEEKVWLKQRRVRTWMDYARTQGTITE